MQAKSSQTYPNMHQKCWVEGRKGERETNRQRERETEAIQLAACNTSHQPRLSGAKVSLYNMWYLTDTVFNGAVKGNV